MSEQNTQDLNEQRAKEYLQKKDTQERIQKSIRDARSKATVTISRAAGLFELSENQLRDWERRGLLSTDRTATQEGKGHRQYSPGELDKLAVIKELIANGKFTVGEIPAAIDEIWASIMKANAQKIPAALPSVGQHEFVREADSMPIDQRVERADKEVFWRTFASAVLRWALLLICEELSDSIAALILPLQKKVLPTTVPHPADLPEVGESLIGWLSQNRSFYLFLDSAPSFEVPSDFRVLPLQVMRDDKPGGDVAEDRTLLVIQRKAKPLTLSAPIVETVRRLLAPLYDNAQIWRSYFGLGMRDELDPAPDLDSSATSDLILDGLANMVVRLGGCTADGQDRWHFCCILLPKDPLLPLQQRTLFIRAQSKNSPHKIGTMVLPDKSIDSLSLRAYQSGQAIYRSQIFAPDASVALQEKEESIHSALAVPIGGEHGPTIAVLYVISAETEAFSESDQRLLRILGRMIEEVISIYRVRHQVTVKLTNAVAHPLSVDPLFEDFLSENDFIQDVEDLVATLKARLGEWEKTVRREAVSAVEREEQFNAEQLSGEIVSFIAVDIDNQSSLATIYGDQVVQNLSKAVGLRIQRQQLLIANPAYRQLYHILADRFYFLLRGVTLDEARDKAEQLRIALAGEYLIQARRASAERLMLPKSMLKLADVTVRLGVTSYGYRKLEEVLQRYAVETAVANVRGVIMHALDAVLNLGQQAGGNVIISFDPKDWTDKRWSPTK